VSDDEVEKLRQRFLELQSALFKVETRRELLDIREHMDPIKKRLLEIDSEYIALRKANRQKAINIIGEVEKQHTAITRQANAEVSLARAQATMGRIEAKKEKLKRIPPNKKS